MRFFNYLGLLISALTIVSCAKQSDKLQTHLSGNRRMAFAIKSFQNPGGGTDFKSYFSSLGQQALTETYQAQTQLFDFTADNILESPDNLFKIGNAQIDDIFVVDISFQGAFDVRPGEESKADADTPNTSFANLAATIYNGSNLRPVAQIRLSVPTHGEGTFEQRFIKAFKKSSLERFPNPNIYPKSNPQYFGDLLFVFSKKTEDANASPLTCENAPSRLHYYDQAYSLYQLAEKRGLTKVVGVQQEAQALQSRLDDAKEKASVLTRCQEDAKKSFELVYDYGTVNPNYSPWIKGAVQATGMEDLLRKYTNKPTTFRFQTQNSNEMTLVAEVRFDPARYNAWTRGRVPERAASYRILSLDPYYALMQKLVMMRSALPAQAPVALKSSFQSMKINLTLATVLNGDIYFGVDGTYYPEKRTIDMKYPNTLYLNMPGFENRSVETKDKEIFQQKGWLTLGSCKTIDGTTTEDGLVYKFFGFPCE